MLLNVLQTPAESAPPSSTRSAIVLASSGARIEGEASQTGEGFNHLFLTLAEGDAELETESPQEVLVAALSTVFGNTAESAQGAIGLGGEANRNLSGPIHVAEFKRRSQTRPKHVTSQCPCRRLILKSLARAG